MLLLASFGRHQICSVVSGATASLRRGRYWSNRLLREVSRKSAVDFVV